MDAQEVRLLQIEGQMNALAQAWLFLAAEMEQQGAIDPCSLERSLLAVNWRGAPLELHGQRLMQQLVEQLADAREQRRQRSRYQATGLDA